MKLAPFFGLFFCILASSCSTTSKSVLLGAGSGVVAGAGTGLVLSHGKGKASGAAIGAALGGVISGIASYFIHQGLEKRDQKVRRETLFNLDKFDVEYPREVYGEDFFKTKAPVIKDHRSWDQNINRNKKSRSK